VGPIKLSNCLSGNGGLVSLTSPELLNSKPRSLLLHLKGFKDKEDDSPTTPLKGAVGGASSSSSDDKSEKVGRYKYIKKVCWV
jgi:hypothetical protein